MRDSDLLPQGLSASVFPEAIYNIPGLFQFADLVYLYLELVRDKFGFSIPVKYLYGAPPVKWNGGRLLFNKTNSDSFSESKVKQELLSAVQHGITPLLTFSNLALSEAELEDSFCNKILQILNLGDVSGEVIVSSKLLFYYIQERYPKIKIHASVIMAATEQKRTVAFYQRLSEQFDAYVIHPDDLLDDRIMTKIPRHNAEILINERCLSLCPLRKQHYASISREQIEWAGGNPLDEKFLENCKAVPEFKQSRMKQRNLSLSIEEVRQLLQLGYRTIKLQGRTDNLYMFFFDLMRYTLEPNVAFPNMYPIFAERGLRL